MSNPDKSVTGLAGVGGGCLAGLAGAFLGAMIGYVIANSGPPRPPMRTSGEEMLADQFQHAGDVMKTFIFVSGGAVIGAVAGAIPGAIFGARRARAAKPPPPAFPVIPVERPPGED